MRAAKNTEPRVFGRSPHFRAGLARPVPQHSSLCVFVSGYEKSYAANQC